MRLRTPSDLRGTVVVITGASSGIGRATAIAAAQRGASVVLAARGVERLESAAAECRSAGGRALCVPTDVSQREQVHALAAAAIERFDRIDVWVNNASVMAYGNFEDVPEPVIDQVIGTNLLGTLHGCRAVLDHFIERERGVIINVASLYAKMTSPFVTTYVTSKFGVLGFSEVLRQELRRFPHIDVVTVLPSSVDTPIFQHAANYTGHPIHPIPPVVDLDRVVDTMLRNMVDPGVEVTVGVVGRVLALAHAAAPPLYRRLVVPVMEHIAFGDGSAPHGAGNVLEHAPPHHQARGGWHEPAARWRAAKRVATLPVRLVRR
jgi:short-subunit dehydrogenase